jgi:hypothetical protein
VTAQVNEEVVPAFFFGFGAHRDAATGLLMRGRGGFSAAHARACRGVSVTDRVNEEVVPAFFFRFGAHRDAATSLFMRGRGGSRLPMRGIVGACL